MKCPKCDHPLSQVYLREVPIEQCLTCQGIWLDSGEFDLIVEREKVEDGWLSKAFKSWVSSLNDLKKDAGSRQTVSAAPPLQPPSMPDMS